MSRNTEFLQNLRRITKFYELMESDICDKYNLSQIEINIIAFLYNNPGKETASDIVELRMLPKGNVSQAVELLIQKGFLHRTQDTSDRRRIHLSLTEHTDRLIPDIMSARAEFMEQIFSGFSEEERALYYEMNYRIFRNATEGLERKKHKS